MLQEELAYLKALWDMVGTVMFTFTDWYATLWDKIDVDFLVEETKKLTKDIKQLNKAVRNYEVYRCASSKAPLSCLVFAPLTALLCLAVCCSKTYCNLCMACCVYPHKCQTLRCLVEGLLLKHMCLFRLLEERLKAMLTSLPLVSDLHHPAMRERHWSQLMKVSMALLYNYCLQLTFLLKPLACMPYVIA